MGLKISIKFDAVRSGRSIIYTDSKNILHVPVFLSLKINLVLANSADPDEMSHGVTFHLGLHGLPKYLFKVSGLQRNN